jgi:hypothetical protein
MRILDRLVREMMIAGAALALGVCAIGSPDSAAASTSGVVRLIAISHTAMAITGNLRLINSPGTNAITKVVFANGRSLQLKDMKQGVYSVTPPANPVLLHGNRLCTTNVKFLAFAFGLRGSATMDAYDGPMKNERNHCGSFNYSEK